MTTTTGHRRLSGVLAALALVAAACGGGASVTPTPTATPQATPTPLDPAAAFLRIVSDAEFSASAKITGSATFNGVKGTVTGTLRGAGPNSDQAITVKLGDVEQTIQGVSIGQDSWTKTGLGPWLPDEKDPDVPRGSLDEWLRSLAHLENLGLETHAGRQLVHLRPEGGEPVPPAALGFGSGSVRDVEMTIDFFAEADGTPAAFVIDASWTDTSRADPVSIEMSLEYALSGVGSTFTILKPNDIWTVNKNDKLGYSMAMPDGWSVKASADGDDYSVQGTGYVYVYPESDAAGLSLDEFEAAVTATYKGQLGAAPASVTPTTLGGSPAKLLLFRWTADDGSPLALIDVVTMHGGIGWEVFMVTAGGDTLQADATLFDTFLASFAFAD